jgi:hypothetical protein
MAFLRIEEILFLRMEFLHRLLARTVVRGLELIAAQRVNHNNNCV